jgi:Ran GTPase-activating protein (RanGAP) involved in mRNA processing and transport
LMDKKDDYKFDVYTEHDWEYRCKAQSTGLLRDDSGNAIGLVDGFIDGDNDLAGTVSLFYKSLRESQFPLERILKASAIDIKRAVASEARDEKYIKNTITNQNEDDDPPEHHDNYEKLNNLIRGFFVSSSLQRILKDESIDSDQKSIYFNILKQSNATVIYLYMLGYTPFDDSVATQLAVSLPPTITSFTFASNGSSVTLCGIRLIFRGLANLTNLEILSLYDNSIDGETCLELANVIRNNNYNIRHLDLRDNKICDEGMKAISDALKNNHSLEILHLKNNQISVEGAIKIATVLGINNTLKMLSLSSNKVGDEGVKKLADALSTNHCLELLDLGGNGISDEGAIAIATVLKINNTLKKLSWTKNKVGDKGVKALADALSTNHCLEELYLGGNEISDEGAIAIAAALRVNNTLQKLTLDYNKVGDEGATSITDALKLNRSLKYLNLDHNSEITEQTMQYIDSTMRKRNDM